MHKHIVYIIFTSFVGVTGQGESDGCRLWYVNPWALSWITAQALRRNYLIIHFMQFTQNTHWTNKLRKYYTDITHKSGTNYAYYEEITHKLRWNYAERHPGCIICISGMISLINCVIYEMCKNTLSTLFKYSPGLLESLDQVREMDADSGMSILGTYHGQ